MSTRRPAPPKPPPPPGAAAPETPTPPPDPPHTARAIGPVMLVLRARITIPATPGYARRVQNLVADLKRSVEEQAPWLRDIEIGVER